MKLEEKYYTEDRLEPVPSYECRFDWAGRMTSVEYDGTDIPLDEVYDLCWRGYPSDKYDRPYKIPETGSRFIECNPHGSGKYSLEESRSYLVRYLNRLKESVDAAHPYTIEDLDVHNHPRYDDYDDYDDDCMFGWENFDDAELIFAKTSYQTTPIFAIKLPAPVNLREPNHRLNDLSRCYDDALNICSNMTYLSEKVSEIFDEDIRPLKDEMDKLLDRIKTSLDEEKKIGRKL